MRKRRADWTDILSYDITEYNRRLVVAFIRWAQQQPGYILPGDVADIVLRFQAAYGAQDD